MVNKIKKQADGWMECWWVDEETSEWIERWMDEYFESLNNLFSD